jgi:hypothetical protein
MLLIVVSVKDRAVSAFSRPVFVQSVGIGVRSFSDEVNRSAADNEMYKHPDDFDLYQLATFDDYSGVFVGDAKLLCCGSQVKIRE